MTLDQLKAAGAPPDVVGAALMCCMCIAYGGVPPSDLRELVTRWIGRNQQQDRYGK